MNLASVNCLLLKCSAALLLITLLSACEKASSKEYQVLIHAQLVPKSGQAIVRLTIPDASLLNKLAFNIGSGSYRELKANGKLTIVDGRAIWEPPQRSASFEYLVDISNERDSGGYDALITEKFALFRGDDLVPTASVVSAQGAVSLTTLEIALPQGWTSVESGWVRANKTTFVIDNPQRRFDRPTGWMIAGQLGIRRNKLESTEFVVAAPKGSELRRMDILSFATLLWPQISNAFAVNPKKVLVVGAGNPMWRGGLSAPNSLYLHEARPLVSENGTSTFVHELVHVATGLSAIEDSDWIVEGLAEYYSFELLYRAGAITAARRSSVIEWLEGWSADVTNIRGAQSKGPVTAKAALLFNQLDREIRAQSSDQLKLDDLVQLLMLEKKVSTTGLRNSYQQLLGKPAKTLQSELLGRL